MTPNRYRTLGDIGQWLAVALLVIAIAIMIERSVEQFSIFTVVASLLFALSTKVKYFGRRLSDNMTDIIIEGIVNDTEGRL